MRKERIMIKLRILPAVLALTAGATAFFAPGAATAAPSAAKITATAPEAVKPATVSEQECSGVDNWGVQEFLNNGSCIAYGGGGLSTFTYTQYAYWVNVNNNYGTIEFNKDHNLYDWLFSQCTIFVFNADSPNTAQVQQLDISGWVSDSQCTGSPSDWWTVYEFQGPGVNNYKTTTLQYSDVQEQYFDTLPQN
jgi:hypothetical protein